MLDEKGEKEKAGEILNRGIENNPENTELKNTLTVIKKSIE